jgi:cell division protein FtsB
VSQQDERLIEEYKQQIEKLQNDITSLTKTKMKTDKKIEKLSTQLTLAEEKARLLEEQMAR